MKTILVVEDDPSMRWLLKQLLRGTYNVITKSNGLEAFSGLSVRHIPDLIISDYRLSAGRTGFEAVARLRGALGSEIPAFLISGDTAPERLREAAASGYHLLHKPVQPNALRALLSQFLRKGAAAPRPIAVEAPAG